MNIYQNFYDLLNTYVFGNTVTVGSYQELVCVLISTLAVLFCVALPFILIWRVIRMVTGA